MPSDAREDRLVRPGEPDGPLVRLLVEPDREDPPDPGLRGPGDQVLRRVVAEAEVSVRIDHAGQCRSGWTVEPESAGARGRTGPSWAWEEGEACAGWYRRVPMTAIQRRYPCVIRVRGDSGSTVYRSRRANAATARAITTPV